MKPQLHFMAIRQETWREYTIRFLFGGAVTATAGLIAKAYGPVVGGLFLAFPAIFPASATMLAQTQKGKNPSIIGEQRADRAVAADAAGAAAGTVALAAFAVMVWRTLPAHSVWVILLGATLTWFGVAGSCWALLNYFWTPRSD